MPDTLIGSDTHMNLDFSIDGEQVGIYRHDPAAGNTIHYNVPVYSNASLSHTQHQIVIRSIAPLINNEHSLLMFDYAVYRFVSYPFVSYSFELNHLIPVMMMAIPPSRSFQRIPPARLLQSPRSTPQHQRQRLVYIRIYPGALL